MSGGWPEEQVRLCTMLFPLTSSITEAGKAKIHTLPGMLAAWGNPVNLSLPVRHKYELLLRLPGDNNNIIGF